MKKQMIGSPWTYRLLRKCTAKNQKAKADQ